jgi:hypothetical protein
MNQTDDLLRKQALLREIHLRHAMMKIVCEFRQAERIHAANAALPAV